MKKKLLFTVSLFIILFSVFQLSGCRGDNTEIDVKEVQNNPLSYIRNEYIKDKNVLYEKDIEWNDAKLYKKKDSVVFITVPIKNTQTNVIEVLSFRIDQGKVLGHLWKYESIKAFAPGDYKLSGHQIMNRMTGKVSYNSLDGQFSYNLKMIAGTSIQDTKISSLDNVMAIGSDALCAGKCHREIPGVEIPGNPGTGPGKDPNPYPDKSPVPPAIMPGGLPSAPETSADNWAKTHIDTNGIKNNKCANDVYKKLETKSELFNNLLGKFKGYSLLNLKFEIKDIGIPANTNIENVKNGYVTVTLNPNYLGSSELGRASLFVHEMLHAYMTWQLVNAGWDGINSTDSYKRIDEKNLPALLKAYREKNYKPGISEHEFISNYYIPKIVNALKAYDPNLGTDSEYEKIAWSGLQETDTYKNKSNKDTYDSIIWDNIKKKPCGN